MAYRESDKLGPKLSKHLPKTGSWLGAALLGFAAAAGAGVYAFSLEQLSMRVAAFAVVMGGLGVYFFGEWRRLSRIGVALHERGLIYVSSTTARLTLAWDEIATLEARYALGLRKRGTADERNRLDLVIVTTGGARLQVPRELNGFVELCAVIEQRTGRPVTRTLVQNLMNR
jgi:hypothetical protein